MRPTAPVEPKPTATSAGARATARRCHAGGVECDGACRYVGGSCSGDDVRVRTTGDAGPASVPVAAATTPPVAPPVLGAAEPPIATDEPLAEPIKPAGDSGNDSPTSPPRAPVNAAAADALPATNVARSPAPVTVQATRTVPATSQPGSTVAAAPAAPALDPGETLPAVNARPVSPDVASTSGVVVPPRVVATAGTLSAATAPAAAPVAAAVTALPPATGAASAVAETAAIESVLSRYAAAFTARDVVAAKSVWPRVNERGLLKAFESVEEQQFDLGACVITANVAQAVALCDGTARYAPKVGSKRMRSEARRWTFRLGQRDGDWSIETVEFR